MTGKQFTILIAEDNRAEASLLVHYLKALECRPMVANDGLGALASLAANHIDAVLLDLGLPDMDGFEVLRKIRLDPTLKNIPVIIISGTDEREAIIRAIKLGAGR